MVPRSERSCFCCWLSLEGASLGILVLGSECACPCAVGTRPSFPTAKFADQACAILTSPKFEACHSAVSPLPYLRNCRYDVCACSDGRDCLCDAVANYAAACARRGVHVGWREPSFCGKCPPRLLPLQANQQDPLGCPLLWARSEHCLCFIATGEGAQGIFSHPSPLPFPGRTGQWGLGSLPGRDF